MFVHNLNSFLHKNNFNLAINSVFLAVGGDGGLGEEDNIHSPSQSGMPFALFETFKYETSQIMHICI